MDGKAEGATVVIGGWETHGGTVPSESRWFSVRLTRKNAPWVFVKGEPFKVQFLALNPHQALRL